MPRTGTVRGDVCHAVSRKAQGPCYDSKMGTLKMTKHIAKFQTKVSERGATAVEYGLMVALIAIVIIVAVALLGTNLSTLFNNMATSV